MGGYAWALKGGEEAAEHFCQANKINPRQISEALCKQEKIRKALSRGAQLDAAAGRAAAAEAFPAHGLKTISPRSFKVS